MASLQQLLSQSVTQSLGLADILAKKQQEAYQYGEVQRMQGDKYRAEAEAQTNIAVATAQGQTSVALAKIQREEEEKLARRSMITTAVGTVAGFIAGGPGGAAIGAKLGSAVSGSRKEGEAMAGAAGLFNTYDQWGKENALKERTVKVAEAQVGPTNAAHTAAAAASMANANKTNIEATTVIPESKAKIGLTNSQAGAYDALGDQRRKKIDTPPPTPKADLVTVKADTEAAISGALADPDSWFKQIKETNPDFKWEQQKGFGNWLHTSTAEKQATVKNFYITNLEKGIATANSSKNTAMATTLAQIRAKLVKGK